MKTNASVLVPLETGVIPTGIDHAFVSIHPLNCAKFDGVPGLLRDF
jgi:hypothetical protein